MSISSVSGLISMLDEPKPELKIFALRQLVNVVDEFWHEISEVIEKLKILRNDRSCEQYKLASLLLSKVYFHLGLFDDSLWSALTADELFDINFRTEYVETVIREYIDFYTRKQCAFYRDGNDSFADCGEFKNALGLALDCRRLDLFKLTVTKSNNAHDLLTYAYTVTTNFIQHHAFKTKVMFYLLKMYEDLPKPDYAKMCQCLILLNDEHEVVEVLLRLTRGNEEGELTSYQIAFDLCESSTQQFLGLVMKRLKLRAGEISFKELKGNDKIEFRIKIKKLLIILSGKFCITLNYRFLKISNKTDTLILFKMMVWQGSVYHAGTVIANGFMYSGTTDDRFLKYNSQWFENTTNWGKTSAVASWGVIHRGEIEGSLKLIQEIISELGSAPDGYIKSGYLYSLGLIYANLGGVVIDYLVDQLKNAENEEIRHGGCLGLGLAAMGTKREDLYEQLKSHLYLDEACTGEAAGIAMGMVMLGSNNKTVIEDMISYTQECKHEKILRGLSVGIALVMYGRFEKANALIDQLEASNDAILRRSAMYTVAMAYCGTGNMKAVRQFLHVAISDVDDDVRRAAVTGLGFLLFKTPEKCLNLVSLLIENYNPHVRYGAAMALGIACAGTGMREALVLLKPIIESDREDFVRQGAFIASAMILIQHNENTCPQVNFFRISYANAIENIYETEMIKFGAILAQGIIDAGGRNVTLSLQSRTGHTKMLSVVGTLMFTQFWYWFPLAHCLSLAFTPTYLMAMNSDLMLQRKLNFKSNVKPGQFGYPPPLKDENEENKVQVKVGALSQTKHKEDKNGEKNDKKKIEIKEKLTFEILPNPARVLQNQLGFMSINEATRYIPMKDVSHGGIIMVRDLTPSDEENVVPIIVNSDEEPRLPQPFE